MMEIERNLFAILPFHRSEQEFNFLSALSLSAPDESLNSFICRITYKSPRVKLETRLLNKDSIR